MRIIAIATVALALVPAFAMAAPVVTAKPTTAIARPLKAEKVNLVKHHKVAIRHKAPLKAKAAVI